jgi:hypothetical protein
MSTTDLHDALETLARLADHDPAPGRLAGITRKRQVRRNRSVALGAAVAVAAVGIGSTAVARSTPDGRGDSTIATSPPGPTPAPVGSLEVALDVRSAGDDTFRVFYQLSGTALPVRDASTGDPIDHGGPLSTRVLLDGEVVGGTDGGFVECDPQGSPETYDTAFGPVEVLVEAGNHTLSVEVDYCGPAGERLTATDRERSYFLGTAEVADRARKDLDGDGTIEQLVLVDEGVPSALEIKGGSVEGRVDFAATDPVWISGAEDLDGDGDTEVLVDLDLGDLTQTVVVTLDGGSPTLVGAGDASPELLNGTSGGRFHGSMVIDGVMTSWSGAVDPSSDPGRLEGGVWALDGTVLRFTPWTTPYCGGPQAPPVEC